MVNKKGKSTFVRKDEKNDKKNDKERSAPNIQNM